MRELDITFELSPWEQMLEGLQPGENLCALQILTLTQDVDDEQLQEQLVELDEKGVTLDISRLPMDAGSGEIAVRLRQEQQLAQKDNLEESDPLRLYLEELAAIPVMGDPAALAQRYLDGENVTEQLVNLSLSFVVELAKAYTGRGVLLMDLIQEGSLGLWQGVLHYRGGDFEQHRNWWIHQYLAKAVLMQARSGELGNKLRQGMEDFRDVDQRLLSELGRNPTLEEIAEAMHITVQQAAVFGDMQVQARAKQRVEETREPVESTPEDDQAVEDTAYFQMRQRIMDLLSTLSEQDAKLLSLRYGLEGGLPQSPQEVGKKLGLTPEEVVEREAKALSLLRQQS